MVCILYYSAVTALIIHCALSLHSRRYVILPKDFEKGYKANVKKGDSEFAFYQ